MATYLSDFLNTSFSTYTENDAFNNSVVYPITLTHTTTDTPANGIGTGLKFITETSSGNNEIGGLIDVVATDVTATSEDFDFVFKNMAAGSAASETFRITSVGNVTVSGDLTVNGGQVILTAAATRDKYRLWTSSTYAVGLDNSVTFGAVNNDKAMTFQMDNVNNQGFWWGDSTHTTAQGAMSLSTNGKLSVAHSLRLGYGETDTVIPGINFTLDVNGNINTSELGFGNTVITSITDNVSAWKYDGNSLDVSNEDTLPTGVFIDSNGFRIFIVGTENASVYKYNISLSAYDLSSASYASEISVSDKEVSPTGVFFKPAGTEFYVIGIDSGSIHQYTLSTPWDTDSATWTATFDVGTQDNQGQGLYFKPDGTKLYVVGSENAKVYEYNLSSAWDITSATYSQLFAVASYETQPRSINFLSDGTSMYIIGKMHQTIVQYNLSTPWDISTSTFYDQVDISRISGTTNATNITGIWINESVDRVWGVCADTQKLYEYDLSETAIAVSGKRLIVNPTLHVKDSLIVYNDAIIHNNLKVSGTSNLLTTNVTGALTVTGAVTMSAVTENISIGTGLTTGTIIVGGTNQTGDIYIGRSTESININIASGATANGNTKNINFGTFADAGSTTNMTVGADAVSAITNLIVNGKTDIVDYDVVNNTFTVVSALYHKTSLTPATGMGTALAFNTITNPSNPDLTSVILLTEATDVTIGNETHDFIIQLTDQGNENTERLRLTSEGTIVANKFKGLIVSADGTTVLNNGTNGTDATFTGNITGNVSGSSGSTTGNAATATKWATARTVTFGTGDVTGNFSIDGSGDVSNVALTIAADSVALGTDTTGNYVATVAAGTSGVDTSSSGLTITSVAGEGTATTIAHADTSTLTGAQGSAGIAAITVDGYGHVTAVTTATYLTSQSTDFKTVTVSDTDTGYTWVTAGSAVAEDVGDTLTIVNGGGIDIDVDATLDAIRIQHTDTSTAVNLTATSRTYVSGLTFDTYGHVTAYTTAAETVVDTNTTYSQSAVTTTGGAFLRMSGSDATTDDVKFASGTNVTVAFTDANTITISSTDTNTNTTYSQAAVTTTGGAFLRMSGSDASTDDVKFASGTAVTVTYTDANTITIDHTDTSSQASVNNSGRTYIQEITLDTYGHITAIASATETVVDTDTTYDISSVTTTGGAFLRLTAGGSGSGNDDVKFASGTAVTVTYTDANTITIDHADTSTQASVNNSGRTYIQEITLDTYGHITAIASATETVVDTDTTYSQAAVTTSGGALLRLTAGGSGSGNDDVKFASGTNITVAYTDANTITVSSTDTDTTYAISSETGGDAYSSIIRLTAGGSGAGTDDVILSVGAVDAVYGLTISETGDTITVSHADTSTQASVNNSGRTYIQEITLDTYGHITAIASATETVVDTDTTYDISSVTTSGGALIRLNAGGSGSGTDDVKLASGTAVTVTYTDANTITIDHTDTSTQASVNNSGRTYIQEITLDTYGHITAIASATETVVDTNTTYSQSAVTTTGGAFLRMSGSDASTDDVKFASGTAVTVAFTDANTITVDHADTSTLTGAQGTAGIAAFTLDGLGHVTAVTTATYLTAEADTLATVTGRGATTATAIAITNATTSNSTTTGALKVTGGVGIVENLYVGGVGSVASDLTVGGNLTVNGTTTTVNSTTVTIDDPVFTLGGDTAPVADDNKDRGIEFNWHNGTVAKVGFFGFNDSSGKFTFIPDATNTSEVFSGTTGILDVASITGSAASLTTTRTLWGQNFDGSANVTGNLTSVGNITGTGAVTLASATASTLTLNSGTTGAITLDSGTTGAVNLGTGASAKVVTVGNVTGASSLVLRSGTGKVKFLIGATSLYMPTADGTNGQVLKTDGLGNLTFESVDSLSGGIANIVEDTTPQLGGDLDVNGKIITSASAGNILITPDTSGYIQLDGLKWPTADGSNGYLLQTDGAGQLSWTSAGSNTTYSISAETSGNAVLRLTGSDASTDDVAFVGAGIASVTITDANTITITATEADTLASVTGRGASTSTAVTLNGGVTTTTTTALALDSGTTGAINIGTTANAKTITIGNGTGATSLVLNAGTGAINIGTNAVARTITIGNTTSASALTLNSGTGAINIGTSIAKTITVGNTTGATGLVLNSGTAGVTANMVATGVFKVQASAAPTTDMVQITNTGFANVTAGVNALAVTYVGGAAAVEGSAMRIDLTPGATTGGTWSGLRLTQLATTATGVTVNVIKADAITTGTGIDNVIWAGTGYDSIISYNGTTVINGTGNVIAGQLSGTIPSAVLGNSTVYVGSTAILLNRATGTQTLTGVSIDGNAATVTNGALTTSTLAQFAATTSLQLAGVISDETGSGALVFATSPTFTTSIDSGATFGAFASSTALTLGYTSTAASTTNISTGAVASATTKTINLGTGGAAGSTTNINIGDADGGTTAIASPTVTVAGVADTATAATHYYVEIATDGTIRPKTLANVKTEIVTTAAVNAAAATTVGTVTTGTWSGLFGAVSGANLTSLTAGNLSGTIPSGVLANSTVYVGTTAIALNRASLAQTLTGVSIDGSSASTTGNALTATTLQTTRTIWGQNFNGSANVTGNLTAVGSITGSTTLVLNSTTTNAITLDSTTTGAVNIGNNANAKTITVGNVTGATGVVLNSGTAGITANMLAAGVFKVQASAAPTTDMVQITNTGFANVTAGVNALAVTYVGGAAAVEGSAMRIDLTSGGLTGGTWSGLRLTQATATVAGETVNVIKADAITAGAGTDNVLWVGTGYDSIINYNGSTIINGTATTITGSSTLTLNSVTTNAIALDSGTTGAVNIGTNANAKTITIGNGTGATSLVLNAGTGAINIGTNAVARTITVGNATGASALTLNSGTGAINIGTSIAKTITVGNTTGATGLVLNSGTSGVTANMLAAGVFKIQATQAPTTDMVQITNAGFANVTAGVNALAVTYVAGLAAVEGSAMRIDLTSGGLTGGTWSGLRLTQATATVAGETVNVIKADAITTGTGIDNIIWAGTGYDSIVNYNGTTVINGTGQIVAAQIAAGTATGLSITGNAATVTGGVYTTGNQSIAGIKTFSNNTASTTNTTGSVVVTGGLGVSGAINAGADVTAYAASDNRLKTNIENIPDALAKVNKLNGVTYNWNEIAHEVEHKDTNVREVGVIAQEVNEVLPEVINIRDNGYMAVRYEKMVPLLIEAIKELTEQNRQLAQRLSDIEDKK